MKNVNEAIERHWVCINRLKSQNGGMRATLTDDGASPHDEYVTFPGPSPVTMSGGVTHCSDHPSSPGSTDSSELSRSLPIHIIRHRYPYQFNPYARPGGKFSPGTPRHLVPSTSPVLAPSQHDSRYHASGPGPVPIPTTLAESAVRAGVKDHDADSDDGDVGDMDVDMRLYPSMAFFSSIRVLTRSFYLAITASAACGSRGLSISTPAAERPLRGGHPAAGIAATSHHQRGGFRVADILNSPESDHRFEPSTYITQQQGSVYLSMSEDRTLPPPTSGRYQYPGPPTLGDSASSATANSTSGLITPGTISASASSSNLAMMQGSSHGDHPYASLTTQFLSP